MAGRGVSSILNLAREDLLLASSTFVHSRFPCCGAKNHLHTNEGPRIFCSAAMRPLAALSAFLDVSSLNLAAPRAPPFFVGRPWQPITPDGGPERRVGSVPGQYPPATLARLRLRDQPDNRVTHELRAVGEHCGGADPNDRLLAGTVYQ